MNSFSVKELRTLCDDLIDRATKMEDMERMANESVGETRNAYAIIHKDHLWKVQKKVGELWLYMCGCEGINPFAIKGIDCNKDPKH
jgi:hypothetical protein